MREMRRKEPWFEDCLECKNDTFKIKVTPIGEIASYTDWYCSKCGADMGGFTNDPLNEIKEPEQDLE